MLLLKAHFPEICMASGSHDLVDSRLMTYAMLSPSDIFKCASLDQELEMLPMFLAFLFNS